MNTPNKDRLRQRLLVGGTVLLSAICAIYYFSGGRFVSTDDAYIQASRVDISANIPGRVTKIHVHDNQRVNRGDLLFELDRREFLLSLAEARAKLASARLQVAAMKASYRQKEADLASAMATQSYRQREFERTKRLAAKGISSQAQLDEAQHALAEARQKTASVRQEQMNLRALLGNDPDIDINAHPSVLQAKAALERAKLSLSYTVVNAPIDGIVAKVEGLQAGDYIKAAAPVFALISDKAVWVEANFKESELAHIVPGQEATVEIDAYPGHDFHGSVESLSPGTGSSFSLLPPENATGNWVKVVQRLPVRISISDPDPKRPLHSGLSAVVNIDTHRSRLNHLWP
ncbi:MAG: HlyD family secretion protein [Burkholderiales bacterium]